MKELKSAEVRARINIQQSLHLVTEWDRQLRSKKYRNCHRDVTGGDVMRLEESTDLHTLSLSILNSPHILFVCFILTYLGLAEGEDPPR